MNLIKNLYQYRELLKTNIKKEIRGKYKGSFLGVLWSFLNPLLMVLVYAIVFPYILRSTEDNYLIFLIVAIIPWNFFTTVLTQGTNCVWINGGILKKVYFPREILPISVVSAGLVNFFISFIIVILFILFSNVGFSVHILWVPFIAILQSFFSLGLLFILSAIDVYVRDVEYLINFFVMLLFYATPILYNASMFPERIRWVLYLNPMSHLMEAYRNVLYYHVNPNMGSFVYLIILSIVIFFVGLAIFRKLEKGFAEEV